MHIPDFMAEAGLNMAILSVRSFDTSEQLNDSEGASDRNLISGVLSDLKTLINKDIVETFYNYDGSKEVGTNSKGENTIRKFTNQFTGKTRTIEIEHNGQVFKVEAVVIYTQEDCEENCD